MEGPSELPGPERAPSNQRPLPLFSAQSHRVPVQEALS